MNPMKQMACQACGTALPFSAAADGPSKPQARPTMKGLRSPDDMTSGLADASPVGRPTSDKTMPSLQSAKPEAIEAHRSSLGATLVGHALPTSHSQHSGVAHSGVTSPIKGPSPRQPPAAQVSDQSATKARVSRHGTLIGHVVPPPTASASQTMPSMQAVTSDNSDSQSVEGSESDEGPLRNRPSPNLRLGTGTLLGVAPAHAGVLAQPSSVASSPQRAPEGRSAQQAGAALVRNNQSAQAPIGVQTLAYGVQSPLAANSTLTPGPSPTLLSTASFDAERASLPQQRNASQTDETQRGPTTPRPRGAGGNADAQTRTPHSVASPVAPPPPRGRRPAKPRVEPAGSRNRRLGLWVLALAGLLIVGLLAFAFLWHPPEPLRARLTDSAGQEALELRCTNCANGSLARYGSAQAAFTDGIAVVALKTPLALGLNSLKLTLERSGFGRNENVVVQVPVDYRLAWDLGGLTSAPPTLGVRVQAAPGVEVAIEGTKIELKNGQGRYTIAVSDDVRGVNSSVQWLEREILPTITGGRASSPPEPLRIRIPIVPLALDTPWSGFITDAPTVVVSGRSAPGAVITVAGNETQTNADGYFELELANDEQGKNVFPVHAMAAEHAPRFASVSLERVKNLKAAAIEYQKGAVRRFDELIEQLSAAQTAAPTTDKSVRVALSGRVQEWKTQGSTTVLLLGVTAGCAQRICVVRVVHPTRLDLERNMPLSVFGSATQSLEGPASHGTLPQVQSYFLLH